MGLSDLPRNYTVNVFCPRCHELFHPRSSKQGNLDGAYFGTTFAHLFLMSHPELIPPKSQQTYIPRVYGFRISRDAAYYEQRNAVAITAREKERDKDKHPNVGGGMLGGAT